MSAKPRFRVHSDGSFELVSGTPVISVNDLPPARGDRFLNNAQPNWHDGDKFLGGFGETKLFATDYWTLRRRSAQLYKENLYARGIIRRLVTNEINTGLTLEAFPEEAILGYKSGELDNWSEMTENRFKLWANNPELCDFYGQNTFYQLQALARQESLVDGDILVIMRQHPVAKLPQIQLVSGQKVRNPTADGQRLAAGHKAKHGIEFDPMGREVAYHILREDGTTERVPAWGPKTGRRLAWMLYGTDKRMDECRGEPLLSLVLQSLKEIDRYRDSAQRKAVINSMLAMFIKKDQEKMGTRPLTGGATRRDVIYDSQGTDAERRYNMLSAIPGITLDELQVGETPQAFGNEGIDINFPTFEEAIVVGISWALEIPPEILRLSFGSNYSASQAAINEFKTYLNKTRQNIGKDLCQLVYADWLLSEVLLQRIDAPGFLDAWRSPVKHDIWGAWLASDWTGSIKPSTDLVKTARGQGMLIDRGLTTHSRATAETTGMSFNRNIKRLRRENEQLVEALRPLREFEAEFAPAGGGAPAFDAEAMADRIVDALDTGDNVA